jgi:hypothetical protein
MSEHLLKRNGIFYYRRGIPLAIRHLMHGRYKDKAEIVISLKTRDRKSATAQEMKINERVQKTFDRLFAQVGKGTSFDFIDSRMDFLLGTPTSHPAPANDQDEPQPTKPAKSSKNTIQSVFDFYLTSRKSIRTGSIQDWQKAWNLFFAITNLNWNSDIELVR